MKVSRIVQENIAYMNELLPVQESYDIVERDIVIGGRESCFFFIDGFMKDEVMSKLMDTFFKITEDQMPDTATEFSRSFVSYVEIDTFSEYDKVIKNLLSGAACLFVEGYDACIIIDSRTYPAETSESRSRTSRCVDPEMGLWRPSFSTLPSSGVGSGIRT